MPIGLPDAAQVERRLGSLRRAGARARGPAPVSPARQGGRRIGLDQRHDLPPRQPRRLRRLGGRRGDGLELRRGAALLQALRGQRARRGRVPRRRWAAERVGQPLDDARWSTTMLEASELAGLDYTPDFNGARQDGVGRFQRTQRNGRRHSTAAAFLHPAESRPNLEIDHRRDGLRILFDGRAGGGRRGRARTGRSRRSARGREVILSAGAYQSPVLLMLSGIGPADGSPALRHAGPREPAGRPRPAGSLHVPAQLRDRRAVAVRRSSRRRTSSCFEREGRGPLTSGIPEAAAFFRTRPGLEAPDMQFHYSRSMFYDEGLTAPHDNGYCFGPVVIKPSSRGRVMLRTPLADSKPRRALQLPHDRG